MVQNAPQTFTDLIGLWGKKTPVAEFARDIGVTTEHAASMKRRDSVPAAHWNEVIAGAERRGLDGITLELLADLAARRKQTTEQAA